MREKEGFRDELVAVREVFGQKDTLTLQEVADYMRVDKHTVCRLIKRKSNPLPAINVSSGKKAVYRISVTQFARWRCV